MTVNYCLCQLRNSENLAEQKLIRVAQATLTLKVLVVTIDALGHFETG